MTAKNKRVLFYRENQLMLDIAGLYNYYQNEDRFVILIRAANESMKPVHDMMPLIKVLFL